MEIVQIMFPLYSKRSSKMELPYKEGNVLFNDALNTFYSRLYCYTNARGLNVACSFIL